MFYCNGCAEKNKWPRAPQIHTESIGPCEVCGYMASCYDVPSKWLPIPDARPA